MTREVSSLTKPDVPFIEKPLPDYLEELQARIQNDLDNNLSTFVESNDDGYIVHSGDTNKGYYALIKKEVIIYVAEYSNFELLENVKQVLVFRYNSGGYSSIIGQHLLFNFLLPRFNSLICHPNQRFHKETGFWGYAFNEVLKRNLYFYSFFKNLYMCNRDKFSIYAHEVYKQNHFCYYEGVVISNTQRRFL